MIETREVCQMLINERHTGFSLLYDPKPIDADDVLFAFKGNDVLLRAEADAGRLPLWRDVSGTFAADSLRHAFSQENHRFFIATAKENTPAPHGFVWENVRVFRTLIPVMDGTLLNAARHLSAWYTSHRFCGACGGPLHPDPVERALTCGHCGLTVFPSILPAVIVAVTNDDQLLLARNANGTWRHFSLIAGFVEVGETAEQTVRREVLEEVGLRVKNIRYTASQPWGFSQSLMLGFTAELDGPAKIVLQETELSEARWFSRAEVPKNNSTASIAFDLIERFRRGLL
jgi:NAD+ diphosphatase